MIDWFYYKRLPKEEQEIYFHIYNALIELKPSCSFTARTDPDRLLRIFEEILFDNPVLYFVEGRLQMQYRGNSWTVFFVYFFPVDQIKKYNALLKKEALSITQGIEGVQGGDEYQKEKVLHDRLINRIVYDNDYDKNAEIAHSIIGVFVFKKAVCDGISKAMKYLLNRVGIRSIVVDGIGYSGEEENHAWNIVKINGKAYHLDATWNVRNEIGIRYDYFNLTDEDIRKDHSFVHKTPPCTATQDNYFTRTGLILSNEREVKAKLSEMQAKGLNGLRFKWRGGEDINAVVERTVRDGLNYFANQYGSAKADYVVNDAQQTATILWNKGD